LRKTIYPVGMPKDKKNEISRKSGYVALCHLRDSYREEYRSAVTSITGDKKLNTTHRAMVIVSNAHTTEYDQLRIDSRTILINEWIAMEASPSELKACANSAFKSKEEDPKQSESLSFFGKLLSKVGLRNVN